jgi:hypothetical protein
VGLFAAGEFAKGTSQSSSTALYVILIPVIALVFCWWVGQFFDQLSLKIVGWLILFTLVFQALFLVSILAGADRYAGFNVFWLLLGEILAPFPALIMVAAIIARYKRALNRGLTKREWVLLIFLSLVFITYYIAYPWDWNKVGSLVSRGGF